MVTPTACPTSNRFGRSTDQRWSPPVQPFKSRPLNSGVKPVDTRDWSGSPATLFFFLTLCGVGVLVEARSVFGVAGDGPTFGAGGTVAADETPGTGEIVAAVVTAGAGCGFAVGPEFDAMGTATPPAGFCSPDPITGPAAGGVAESRYFKNKATRSGATIVPKVAVPTFAINDQDRETVFPFSVPARLVNS